MNSRKQLCLCTGLFLNLQGIVQLNRGITLGVILISSKILGQIRHDLHEILYNGYTIEKMDSMEIIIIQEVVGFETLVALNFDLDRGPDLLGLFI
jgi:hypothetical protein